MPLQKRKCRSKRCLRKAVSVNIRELVHHGKRKRSMRQIIAISYAGARRKK